MSALKPMRHLIDWWRERTKVARLTQQAEAASAGLRRAHEEAKEKKLRGEDAQEYTSEAWDEYRWSSDALEDALHTRLVRRAYKLRVPFPQRTKDSDNDWEESVGGNWRLSDPAAYKLRRALAEEAEIRARPWLNWGPFVISGLGLVVAILSLLGGGA